MTISESRISRAGKLCGGQIRGGHQFSQHFRQEGVSYSGQRCRVNAGNFGHFVGGWLQTNLDNL